MASANGAVTSQIMSQIAGQLQQQVNAILAQQTAAAQQAAAPHPIVVTDTDVVPLHQRTSAARDSTAAAFPMVLGGMLGGILVALLVAGVRRCLVSLAAYAVIAGAGLAAIMQAWFGVLQGDYLANASAIALSLFATGAFIVGMTALIGPPGIAVGAIVTLLIGNPISAAAQPLEFLPDRRARRSVVRAGRIHHALARSLLLPRGGCNDAVARARGLGDRRGRADVRWPLPQRRGRA